MSMSLPEYVDAALPPQDGGETRPPVDSSALGVQLGSELKTAINARGLYENSGTASVHRFFTASPRSR